MTSQLNTNLACPSTMPMRDEDNKFSLTELPPPPLPPPVLASCDLGVPPPPRVPPPSPVTSITPSLMPPLFLPFVPPPICNTALPPIPIPSHPPPAIPHFFRNNYVSNQKADPKSDFEQFKQILEERYKKSSKEKKRHVHLKVSEIKQKLVQCCNLMKQLENLTNCLQVTHKSMSDEEWSNRCKEAEKLKVELSNLIQDITGPSSLKHMKRAVLVRKKKRDYKKRKQKEWQEEKREAKLYAEQEHRRIDMWLEKMKDQVSRAKREEDIKREADLVLSDVTAKKAEAKRMLNMLNSLAKLRAARAHNLSSVKLVGENESNAFNEVIDRLKKMWLDQFNGYKVEEEGLKVMLGHAEEERTSIEATKLRKNLNAWYKGIFGSSQSSQPESVEELVQIRHDWDKFICTEDTPMASRIPVGWVLPCEPSSPEWAALLHLKA